jgi:hypothetical protein
MSIKASARAKHKVGRLKISLTSRKRNVSEQQVDFTENSDAALLPTEPQVVDVIAPYWTSDAMMNPSSNGCDSNDD